MVSSVGTDNISRYLAEASATVRGRVVHQGFDTATLGTRSERAWLSGIQGRRPSFRSAAGKVHEVIIFGDIVQACS